MIEANPRNYIAQPTLDFSRAGCLTENGIEPRHVDLRPYILYGDKVTHCSRGADQGRSAPGLPGGELIAGWRQQRYLGFE